MSSFLSDALALGNKRQTIFDPQAQASTRSFAPLTQREKNGNAIWNHPAYSPENIPASTLRVFATPPAYDAPHVRQMQGRLIVMKPRSRRGWENGGKAQRKLAAARIEQARRDAAAAAKQARAERQAKYQTWLRVYGLEHSRAALLDFDGDLTTYATYAAQVHQHNAKHPVKAWDEWLTSVQAVANPQEFA